MKSELVDEVIACLPKGKTHYHYYKGGYAPKMLKLLLPEEIQIRQLKQSRLNRMLSQSSVKQVLANAGGSVLRTNCLSYYWPQETKPFLLSLSRWGGSTDRSWHQTSRYGENIVLQLNLPISARRRYLDLFDQTGRSSINGYYSAHPVQKELKSAAYRDTIAWARIDLDFKHNEALIEEIQSDSVRDLYDYKPGAKRCGCKSCKSKLRYLDWFDSYKAIWSEAMLMAVIEFIVQELGLRYIFIHSHRSGWRVKKMHQDWHAPRSLYSGLPKKFGFKRTWSAPMFLQNEKCYQSLVRKQPDIDFYYIDSHEFKEMKLN